MSGIGKARRGMYRWGKVLGDVRAIERSAQTRSPVPVARRIVRRSAWRTVAKLMRRSGL